MLFVVLLFGFAIVLMANIKARSRLDAVRAGIALTVIMLFFLSILIGCGANSTNTSGSSGSPASSGSGAGSTGGSSSGGGTGTGTGSGSGTGGGTGSGGSGGSGSGGSGSGGTGSGGGSTTTTATAVNTVTVSSASITAGGSLTATVTLNAVAPTGGAAVTLTSSNASVASIPASMSVSAGQTAANFTVSTRSVSSDTAVTITAAFNNTYANVPITVRVPPPPPPNPISVSVSPASVSVLSGGNQQFTSTVTGSTNMGVTWTASGGTINSLGYFTAPSVTANTTLTVYATSQADPTVVKTVQVTVVPFVAPPSGGDPYSGSGPVASWKAYQYLDTDGRYHQAIYISNATGAYPVIGYSYSSAGCADLGDTFNDYWEPLGNGLWWFINRPSLVYVRWVWYNNITEKTILQQTPCIDYSGAPKYN